MVNTSVSPRTGWILPLTLLCSCWLTLPLTAIAQTIESIDTQPNDTFGDRVVVSPGIQRIYGGLDPVDIPAGDYVIQEYLESEAVDEFRWADLSPGTSFFAWITMNRNDMDPIMGLFDEAGALIQWDDDSSPTTGLAPAIRGTIAESGVLHLKVSGIGDDDFNGTQEYYYSDEGDSDEESVSTEPHYQSGEYTLSVLIDATNLTGDVDFFTLNGLTPGHGFTVAESMSESGVRLGWIGDDGTVVRNSTYSERTYREQLDGIVPATGQIHIAVSGYDDTLFDGQHTLSGEYVLRVETSPEKE